MMKLRSAIFGALLAALSCGAALAQVGQLGTGQLWANPTASQARAAPTSLSAYLDFVWGSTANGFPARLSGSWTEAAFGSSFSFSGSTLNLNAAAATVLGGSKSLTCASHQWFNSLSTAGAFNCAQPALADLPTGSQDTVLGYWTSTVISATSMPNCTGALTYSTSTHTFGCNTATGTGTVTSVGLANSYGLSVSGSPVTTSGNISAGVNLTNSNNILGADVSIPSGSYADGPSMAQGSTGTWFASGQVTIDASVGVVDSCKLWDGTTVIASGQGTVAQANFSQVVHLAGILATPAGNIRISCSGNATGSSMKFNATGNSKDSSIFGVRIQ